MFKCGCTSTLVYMQDLHNILTYCEFSNCSSVNNCIRDKAKVNISSNHELQLKPKHDLRFWRSYNLSRYRSSPVDCIEDHSNYDSVEYYKVESGSQPLGHYSQPRIQRGPVLLLGSIRPKMNIEAHCTLVRLQMGLWR